VNRNPGTANLASEGGRSTCHSPRRTGVSGGPQGLPSERMGRTPKCRPSRHLAGASSNLVLHKPRRGGWGGAILLLGLLPLFFLVGCGSPRLQGDTSSGNWYGKVRVTQF
jgi:hypothetical protein